MAICLIGDFNDILAQSKKMGQFAHPNWLIEGFQQTIQICGLNDLGMIGHKFTWEKS